jgi:hypothetical protein
VRPNKRVEPTLAIGLPSLPLRSANCQCGSPLVLHRKDTYSLREAGPEVLERFEHAVTSGQRLSTLGPYADLLAPAASH